MWDVRAEDHGSCVHENKKRPVQDDEYNYHDSLQACLIEGIGHYKK